MGGDITSTCGTGFDGASDIGKGSGTGITESIELANCTLHTKSIVSSGTITPSLNDAEALEKAGVKFVIP